MEIDSGKGNVKINRTKIIQWSAPGFVKQEFTFWNYFLPAFTAIVQQVFCPYGLPEIPQRWIQDYCIFFGSFGPNATRVTSVFQFSVWLHPGALRPWRWKRHTPQIHPGASRAYKLKNDWNLYTRHPPLSSKHLKPTFLISIYSESIPDNESTRVIRNVCFMITGFEVGQRKYILYCTRWI